MHSSMFDKCLLLDICEQADVSKNEVDSILKAIEHQDFSFTPDLIFALYSICHYVHNAATLSPSFKERERYLTLYKSLIEKSIEVLKGENERMANALVQSI
ncbi:hypothetical protein [Halobacteriovorax sp. CON-3]|uniref:hypothetical protein n=1 Tax=Halobacteriovorax sp. CON-3 TaxID=3157710 RepID=UPI00371EB410